MFAKCDRAICKITTYFPIEKRWTRQTRHRFFLPQRLRNVFNLENQPEEFIRSKQEPAEDNVKKLLKVTIIGMPNAGKSTLINGLVHRKVCPSSSKVHTTRMQREAVITDKNIQIVFLDTPGIVNQREIKKYNLGVSFWNETPRCLDQCDIIGVIHDASFSKMQLSLDIKLMKLLEKFPEKPSILLMNKVDAIKRKSNTLEVLHYLTSGCLKGVPFDHGIDPITLNPDIKGWPNFDEVFMISALTGSGLEDLERYFKRKAKPSPWMYKDLEQCTNSKPVNLICDMVKAKLLDFLPQEIPYQCKVQMEHFKDYEENISTVVTIICPTRRIAKVIYGGEQGRLVRIKESIRNDLESFFKKQVTIEILLQSRDPEAND